MYAAEHSNNVDAVKFLVAKGADPKAKDPAGNTAIKLAQTNKHPEIVKYLEQLH